MTHGCGFASWGEALRRWCVQFAILGMLLLAACLPGLPTRRAAEATPTPAGGEFYRGVYATCYEAMTVSGVGDTAVLTLCQSYTDARRGAEWHATEWPGYEP